MPEQLTAFREIVGSAAKWVLISHVNPDGDALGALRGMGAFLHSLGHQVSMMLPNPYPDFLAFLDADKAVQVYKHHPRACEALIRQADAICCLDMSTPDRLEALFPAVAASTCPRLMIDHHPLPDTEGFDLVLSAPQCSSSCELVYRLIQEAGLSCPPTAAQPLYAGLMTDTNNFANSVQPETFEVAAALLRLGIDKEEIQQQVFCAFSQDRLRLMAHTVLQRMVVLPNYAAAYMIVSLEEQQQYHFVPGDTEGFVNIPLTIKGVNLAALFVETPAFVRVSLRSCNGIEVHEIARRFFEGGGHKQASGGKLYQPLSQVPALFLQALQQTFPQQTP